MVEEQLGSVVGTLGRTEVGGISSKNIRSLPSPVKIEDVDRLRAENMQLKMDKVTLEIALTTQQLVDRGKVRAGLGQEIMAMQAEYRTKYGIDLLAGKINDDGTFMANPSKG